MKKIAVFLFALISALAIAGCKQDAPGGEIQLSRELDFGEITQVKLVNVHNGYLTTITDENDIAEITAFVGETIGKPLGSGKDYYEGSYSLIFSDEDGEEIHLTYGDDDVFYWGEGDDGYPIRYRLCHISIAEDVLPFFSRYDQSGMPWEENQ